jgi:cbb3-type cytochrome oxidase maturation protein
MESIFLLLPISLVLVLLIGAAFWWAVFAGQFDDTNRAAKSVILDDDNPVTDDDVSVRQADASVMDADQEPPNAENIAAETERAVKENKGVQDKRFD